MTDNKPSTKTVAFVNLKGGVGKTTSTIGTAEALARLGRTVVVRDIDPSAGATLWSVRSERLGRPLPFRVETANRYTVGAPADEEWVLIDTPPLQEYLVEAAVDAADLVLLVSTPGTLDLDRLLETFRHINKPSSALLTQTRHDSISLRNARERLAANGVACCDNTIPYREAMRRAAEDGRFPSASGYGLIADELRRAFAA